MSRKIELTRIHAINWFGYNDVLDVTGNLLIAGVTGSGKSILMDLVQLVLIGDQKSRYNQSATGSASTRTLKSYCLGDTKQEINGVAQYMRDRGGITYVALEFTWPGRKRVETWGLRIEFDSAAQNQPTRRNGFLISRRLEKSDWLHEDRTPLDFSNFRRVVRETGEWFETMESYRREMSLPSHLNFDRGTLDYLLPAAMSFTFLKSFNDFCRQYILPADDIDIQPVKESFLAFRSFERELGILQDQFNQLQVIRNCARQWEEQRRDAGLLQYLEAELRAEAAAEECTSLEKQITDLEKALESDNQRLSELDTLLTNSRQRRDELLSAINATENGPLFLELRKRNKLLAAEIEDLRSRGKTVQQVWRKRLENTDRWLKQMESLPVQPDPALLRETQEALLRARESGDMRGAIRRLASAARRLREAVQTAAKPLFEEETRLNNEQTRLGELLAALRLGVVPEASVLLNTLNQQLPHSGREKPARALRELCEVTDEEWRPAIEVAFSRKFAVVVEPENFDKARTLFHELKAESPRESLIHPKQALELRGEIRPGSLAEKLETSHPVAAAVVRQAFGDLMCVRKPSELSKHPRSILPDGFQYQRPFVERRGHYKNNPCIGSRGLEKHRQHLQSQLDDTIAAGKVIQPKTAAIRECVEMARSCNLESESVHDDLASVEQLSSKEQELKGNIRQMTEIRDHDLDTKEKLIAETDTAIRQAEEEQKNLLRNSRQSQLVQLRQKRKHAEELRSNTRDRLSRIQAEGADISADLDRYRELRESILTERPILDPAADLAKDQWHDAREATVRLRGDLINHRRELALTHPAFQELDPEAESNANYDARLDKISDSDIPGYREKAEKEKRNWQHLFRTQVLAKLHAALFDVEQLIAVLNQELRSEIGNSRYQITRKPNPDQEYKIYRDLIDASAAVRGDEDLFFESMNEDIRATVEALFHNIVEKPDSREVLAFLDYRSYHDYDMLVSDPRHPDARPTSVDRQAGKFSGGENQSPYFIAILACYLRAYHRYERRRRDPSLALVPIDEAFSKLSGERIRDCIEALKQLGLQGVFSMSSGNIPYAMDMCDQMITVMKRERTAGNRISIRNVPVILTREEALERYGRVSASGKS